LRIGERGGIKVNERLETSVDGIWAVGDAIEVVQPVSGRATRIALGGPANRQGRIVADNIFGGKDTYRGTLGTAILRVFDLTAAMTGLNETQLSQASIPFEVVHLHPSHHAGYFPGATRLDIKLLFHSRTGVILGAQVVGKEGVDKRIDVLVTALKAGMTVRELAELELAYAPPFGSAKDPINLVGMAAVNVLDGLLKQVQPGQLAALGDSVTLIDVRSSAERHAGFIPGSMHIPLNDLRKSVTKIASDKPVVVYCQSGQRTYYASRFLAQHGFAVKNLSGGYLTWRSLFGKESCTNSLALAPQAVSVPG
jgi:rhodanese-related sulfurtransferase